MTSKENHKNLITGNINIKGKKIVWIPLIFLTIK